MPPPMPSLKRKGLFIQEDEDADDALSVVESVPTNIEEMQMGGSQAMGNGSGVNHGVGGINLHLTPAGIRLNLKRTIRPKPLLRIVCRGCGRSTHDPDTYIPSDFLEYLVF